ncbi:MAG: acyltransferase family protein, partial [Acidimicrobiia bacterium]
FAPLLGCMVAIGIYEGRFRHPTRNLSALTVAVLIAAACLPLHFADRRLLWGAIPIGATAALAIPASLHQPASWLNSRVLRWFGKISYGLYLWHYMLISMPWERLPLPTLIPMTVTPIAAAALSWYFLEGPLLRRRQRAGDPHPPTPHFNAPEVAASQPA